jgi:hypothetical protein
MLEILENRMYEQGIRDRDGAHPDSNFNDTQELN